MEIRVVFITWRLARGGGKRGGQWIKNEEGWGKEGTGGGKG
jgi:hypothetical protein